MKRRIVGGWVTVHAVATVEKSQSRALTQESGIYTEVRRVVSSDAGCPFIAQVTGAGVIHEGTVEHRINGEFNHFESTKIIKVWKVRRGVTNAEMAVLDEHLLSCLPPAGGLPWKHVRRRA